MLRKNHSNNAHPGQAFGRHQRGFTLVEIAIVLVIVGLLLGGILKGQEMIVQARIKATVSDFNGVLAAHNAYIDRYRALPGDDAGAPQRWTSPTAAGAGDANAVIGGAYASSNATDESRLYWDHLRRAGFIPGQGSAQPTNAHNGIFGVQTGDGASTPGPALAATGVSGLGGVLLCASQIPDKVAIALDNQMDDGQSASGQVRARQVAGNGAIGAGSLADAAYHETGTSTYVACRAI
jgi:prepilin-type N-terminal cleavage/methylation domain-containing protein